MKSSLARLFIWQFAEHKNVIRKHKKIVDSNGKKVYNIIIGLFAILG